MHAEDEFRTRLTFPLSAALLMFSEEDIEWTQMRYDIPLRLTQRAESRLVPTGRGTNQFNQRARYWKISSGKRQKPATDRKRRWLADVASYVPIYLPLLLRENRCSFIASISLRTPKMRVICLWESPRAEQTRPLIPLFRAVEGLWGAEEKHGMFPGKNNGVLIFDMFYKNEVCLKT